MRPPFSFWSCPKRECAAPGGREKSAGRAPVQWPSARTGVGVSVPAPIWAGLRARYALLRICNCRSVADGADLVGVVVAWNCFSFTRKGVRRIRKRQSRQRLRSRCRWLGGDWEACRKGKICMGRWIEQHSRGLGCLVLLAVTLAVLLRPVPFREFAHSDRATEFYVTAFVGDLRRTLEARPDQAGIPAGIRSPRRTCRGWPGPPGSHPPRPAGRRPGSRRC